MSKWALFVCSDCALDEGAVIVQVPDDARLDRSSGIDYCPGCGNYLSLLAMGEVEVSGRALIHLDKRFRA